MYEIAGVHHVALGVENMETMKSFYRDRLGFNIVEPPAAPHDIMAGIMRGLTPDFAVSMLSHDGGDMIVEFIHMINPAPQKGVQV